MKKASAPRISTENAGIATMLFSILLFWLITTNLCAQQGQLRPEMSMDSSYRIEWAGQYPPREGERLKRRFSEKFVDFITGQEMTGYLSKPIGVLAHPGEELFILDQGNKAIIKVKDQVGEITHFKNNKALSFPSLVGICPFIEDKFLITDSFLNKIFVVSPDKKTAIVLDDTLHLEQPTGIAYNPLNKEIWVVETKAHRISILDETGQKIREIGKRGTGPGEFNFPTSIWIDESGTVFIVDAMNFRIQIFSKDGEFESSFGKIGDATGSFARPKGIATDSFGNIYVVDALFHAVQIFDRHGNFLYYFGNQGQLEGEFWMPSGIYIDRDNTIYIADTYNSRIQVFHLVNQP